MTYTFLPDVLDDKSDANIKMLDKIWQLTEDRHRFFINDIDLIEKIRNSDWFKLQRPSYKEAIEGYITWSIQSSVQKAAIIISNTDNQNHFSPDEAFEILNQIFEIVLENGENDVYFINALTRTFKKKGKLIAKHWKEGCLKFGMGGGSAITNVINEGKRRFESDKDKFPKESYRYLRYFVLVDSDRTFQNEKLKKDKENLVAFLNQNQIQHHVLEKREMENYLPDEAFSEIENNDDYLSAYLELTPIQKDYVDIEKGFSDKNFDQLPPEVKKLYRDVSEPNKKILRKNQLNFRGEDGVPKSFKSEFPKLFDSEKVTQERLLFRTQHQQNPNELQDILEKITKFL